MSITAMPVILTKWFGIKSIFRRFPKLLSIRSFSTSAARISDLYISWKHAKKAHWFHYRSLKFIVGPIRGRFFILYLFLWTYYHQRHDKSNSVRISDENSYISARNGNEAGRIDFNRSTRYRDWVPKCCRSNGNVR